jgi:AcrR family transcriptional regulator
MAQLDKNRIAAAALAILDKKGVAGFTIRAVADALGASPMALYRHVQDKADLALLAVNAAAAERSLSAPTGDWRQDLLAMARWMRDGARAHPAISSLWRMYRIYTPEFARMAERWLSLWQQSGLDLDSAVLAAMMAGMAIGGMIAEESALRTLHVPDETMLAQLPNARLLLHAKYDADQMFEIAVLAIIDGLHARLRKDHGQASIPPL